MIDMYQEILNKSLIAAQNAAAATVTGTGVDTKGYQGWAKISLDSSVASGATTTGILTIETSDALSSGYTAVSVYDYPNGTATAFTTCNAATAAQEDRYIDLSGAKRYVRAVFTIAGGSANFGLSVIMTVRSKRLPGS